MRLDLGESIIFGSSSNSFVLKSGFSALESFKLLILVLLVKLFFGTPKLPFSIGSEKMRLT
jgi:hypothetical protein